MQTVMETNLKYVKYGSSASEMAMHWAGACFVIKKQMRMIVVNHDKIIEISDIKLDISVERKKHLPKKFIKSCIPTQQLALKQ